jgi:hypothetical protein
MRAFFNFVLFLLTVVLPCGMGTLCCVFCMQSRGPFLGEGWMWMVLALLLGNTGCFGVIFNLMLRVGSDDD